MSSKSRRRITLAAGAAIAGAAIPIATAFTAWADDIEITYDGKVIFDNFDTMHPFGSSDVGTAAESGTNNDWAIVEGPASYANEVGLANDSAGSDSNDVALYQGTTDPTTVYGQEGATIVNGTNSNAEVFGGGTASINMAVNGVEDPVSNSTALATNGGFADVSNDGLAPPGVTVTGDFADANGTATGTLADGMTHGLTPSVANIYDSGSSTALANDTGTNLFTGEGGAAVDLAKNSFAEAVNPGSGANIIGTGTTAVVNSSNIEPDGDIFNVFTSNTAVIDGIPDTTFFADLFGAGGSAAAAADWAIVAQLFGL
jgi:hypothetical protein